MKTSLLIASAFVLFFSACQNSTIQKNVQLDQLQTQKQEIDKQISDKSLLVYAKVKGKDALVQVENKRYPADIETTYNILKNSNGKVVYLAELPYGKTTDWFIAYKNYFDANGNLFVFQRINNFMNSKCTRGAALENLTRYYNRKFTVIDSAYSLTDSNQKPLDEEACDFPYNFDYQIYKNLEEYRKAKGITVF